MSENEVIGNSFRQLVDFIDQNTAIGDRIDTIAHPDDVETKVPVVLETGTDDNGETISRVVLAKDILAELDKRLPGPARRRRRNSIRVTELASLIDYVKRYGGKDTVVYADTKALGFTVVLDEHPAGECEMGNAGFAAWREHRVLYDCPRSPEWVTWTSNDGRQMKQDEFADFLEGRLEDLTAGEPSVYPKPTDILGIARQLHIKTKGTFQREVNVTTGDHILVCKTETETGSTQIPRAFAVAIPVFEGGERYQVEARVRFALVNGVPAFSYGLYRRSEIERDAFNAVRAEIVRATSKPLIAGTP